MPELRAVRVDVDFPAGTTIADVDAFLHGLDFPTRDEDDAIGLSSVGRGWGDDVRFTFWVPKAEMAVVMLNALSATGPQCGERMELLNGNVIYDCTLTEGHEGDHSSSDEAMAFGVGHRAREWREMPGATKRGLL